MSQEDPETERVYFLFLPFSLAGTPLAAPLSQAPDNLTQSKYALEFGEVFAKLNWTQPRQVRRNPKCYRHFPRQ